MPDSKIANMSKEQLGKMYDIMNEIEGIFKRYNENITCFEIVAILETLKVEIINKSIKAAGAKQCLNTIES